MKFTYSRHENNKNINYQALIKDLINLKIPENVIEIFIEDLKTTFNNKHNEFNLYYSLYDDPRIVNYRFEGNLIINKKWLFKTMIDIKIDITIDAF